MKIIVFLLVVVLGMANNAVCDEINASITKAGNNTIVTCSPMEDREIEKAYLTLYSSDNQPLYVNRREMNVSYDNNATYELSGGHYVLEGKCKFVLARGKKKILRGEFLVSMK